ncbi:MAG: M48 family metallopeptidase [Cyclobacteriaceae bacterium]
MNDQQILFLLLGIIVFDFVLENLVDFLNHKSANKNIPKPLEGIYDEESYRKSQEYGATNYRFSLITGSISFLATVAILYFGWFGTLDQWVRGFAQNELVLSLYFFGILYFISDILTIPFQLYGTFVIEEKFGFNKSSIKTFIVDKLKGYVLAILLGGILLVALILLVFALGKDFWLWFWLVITVFMIFMNMFYTSLIVPLFNKLTPLASGDLRTAIEEYAQKVSFPLTNIFVIDGSKRSSKANAFFSGFGKNKKVVLYDMLIEKHTSEELVAVLAHEVGHFKKKHIIGSMILGIAQTGLMLYLLSQMIFSSEVTWAMGGETTALHLNMLAFGILYSPLSKVLGILMSVYSRKNEYEADAYASITYDNAPLESALKKLSGDNLSNLTPHPLYVFLNYSHPTLLQRITAMRKYSKG